MKGSHCINPECGYVTEMSSTLYWCGDCNIPIYEKVCSICGREGSYVATDLRPVFPEENLLISILLADNPFEYQKDSVWYGSNSYIVNGKKVKLSVSKINKKSIDEIKEIKDKYDRYATEIDYQYFNEYKDRFVKANKDRFNFITEEAVTYIQQYMGKYDIDDMMVSFSGGKDSTVTSHLVNQALGTNKVLHVFGDTTLEFPYTLEYKKRFRNNEESQGVRILTAKNREKNFEDLCEVVGPPSRVMRWCCTVFKTGAIQKTISSAFKDKTNILSFQGIRHNESASRSKYDRESESPKISKQTVVAPIIDWIDYDVWLYILTTGIDFNYAYRLGWTRVGCWCCPNNGAWSEFLAKIHMYEQYVHWHSLLVDFARQIGKPDPEDYVDEGGWKARQGGNGLAAAQTSIVSFEPCANDENAFNYELQKPITDELYELFKPFGYINKELGNKRLGEVYVINKAGKVVLVLQGRVGSKKLKL
jgi:phosphoadenosine phosphosulfate reductase